MSVNEAREPLDIVVEDEPANIVRWAHRVGWMTFVLFFAVLLVVTIGVTVEHGVVAGVLAGLGFYLLPNLTIFDIDASGRLVTDESPSVVRDELAEPYNPFTLGHFVVADAAFEAGPSDEGDVILVLNRSTRLQHTKHVSVAITEHDDGDIEIHHGGNHSGATTHISIEPSGGNTFVRVTTHRSAVSLYQVCLFRLNDIEARRLLRYYGYRLVDEKTSLSLSL